MTATTFEATVCELYIMKSTKQTTGRGDKMYVRKFINIHLFRKYNY